MKLSVNDYFVNLFPKVSDLMMLLFQQAVVDFIMPDHASVLGCLPQNVVKKLLLTQSSQQLLFAPYWYGLCPLRS